MSDWYCPLPFKHAYVDTQGISACCQTPRYPISIGQWLEHPDLKKLQTQLLTGQPPEVCKTCVLHEHTQGRSLRTDSDHDYGNQRFDHTQIDFVDFRSQNICNFKCRSCFPQFSHGIAQEVNKYPKLERFLGQAPASKVAKVTEENVEWIMQNLGSLKRIMFTGGEPTVIPGVMDLITKIKNHYPDIKIMITSNASFTDSFWYDITTHLHNLHWTVSVDRVGDAAKIVRHGSDWSVIEHNVSWLAQHATSLNINSVVSNLSVFGLRPLLEFGHKMQGLSMPPTGRHGSQGCRHQFFVCQRPYWLAADNWPDPTKTKLLEYLAQCQNLDLDQEQANMLNNLINQIQNSTFDEQLWARNLEYNSLLDVARGEDHLQLYEPQVF